MSQKDRLTSEPPRSRVPMVIGAVVAIIAVIAATVAITSALSGDKTAPPSPSSSSSSKDTSDGSPVTGGEGAGALGCLGGVSPNKAVLEAQDEAALDSKGAAAFAATVMRWRTQFPVDPTYDDKAKKIMTPDAGSDLLTVNPPEGSAKDSGWGTTNGARYLVKEVGQDSATVELSMPFFVTSEEYPDGQEVSTAARWRLAVIDGKWRVADMDSIDKGEARTDLESRGLTFEGVC